MDIVCGPEIVRIFDIRHMSGESNYQEMSGWYRLLPRTHKCDMHDEHSLCRITQRTMRTFGATQFCSMLSQGTGCVMMKPYVTDRIEGQMRKKRLRHVVWDVWKTFNRGARTSPHRRSRRMEEKIS